jgi:hypothetical protein
MLKQIGLKKLSRQPAASLTSISTVQQEMKSGKAQMQRRGRFIQEQEQGQVAICFDYSSRLRYLNTP